MPTLVWRGTFRFWLSVLAADPDTRRGVKDLLISYDDAYHAVDHAAIRYDDGIHVKHRLTHYHDFFVERVQAGDRVLDIGSGKGELASDLATISGATVVGVDHDPGHVAFAKQRFTHPNLHFLEGEVLDWLPDGHFDVVVLSNVLEHLEGRVEFLRGVISSATPDRLLFRVPVYERDWTVPLRDEVGLLAYWDSDHTIEYTPDSFIAELADAGLEVGELVLRWGEIWASAGPGRCGITGHWLPGVCGSRRAPCRSASLVLLDHLYARPRGAECHEPTLAPAARASTSFTIVASPACPSRTRGA